MQKKKEKKSTRKHVRTDFTFQEAICHGIKPPMSWNYVLNLVMPCQNNMEISLETTLKKGNLGKITSATYQYLSLQTSEVNR